MDLLHTFVDAYLDGRMPLPDIAVLGLVDVYVRSSYLLSPRQDAGSAPAQTEAIAARSQELMETHYNLPLSMFEQFLGPSMKYSVGLWRNGVRSLDEAQEAMLVDVCDKADIGDGQRILDLGCGFGSLAAHVLRRFPNARVDGLTLSRTQADYLRARQTEPGHPLNTERFSVILADFNDVVLEQRYDRIVSLGMFEHVTNLDRALEKMRGMCTPDGRVFLHYIVYRPRPGDSGAPRQDAFIDQYVFPGGRVWAYPELTRHTRQFRIDQQWFLDGHHYKRTLQAWLRNYRRNRPLIARTSGLTQRQLRLWELYLCACVSTFRVKNGRYFGNGQYLLSPL